VTDAELMDLQGEIDDALTNARAAASELSRDDDFGVTLLATGVVSALECAESCETGADFVSNVLEARTANDALLTRLARRRDDAAREAKALARWVQRDLAALAIPAGRHGNTVDIGRKKNFVETIKRPQLALLIGDEHGIVKGKPVAACDTAACDADATGLFIKGDECTFFPNFERAKKAAEDQASALEADGWKKSAMTPTALDFLVVAIRGDVRSKVALAIAKSLGDDVPLPCPKEFVVVNDNSGKQRRSCDFYICKQLPLHNSDTGSQHATASVVTAAQKWFGEALPPRGREVELPNPPWQRGPQIDAIWYRRHAVEGLSGRYEHKYRPSVPIFVSSKPLGWRIALPDGCIVDERGFVAP